MCGNLESDLQMQSKTNCIQADRKTLTGEAMTCMGKLSTKVKASGSKQMLES